MAHNSEVVFAERGQLPEPTELTAIQTAVIGWFEDNRRDLPWRDTTPWGVLVSEVMLQQTPVARVLPVWREWLARWPTPADLAAEPTGAAIRAWGRLGYPRRALRLHGAAGVIVAQHNGAVPATYDDLIALPGVGDYTANAVLAYAYAQRAAVLDVNVRRLYARLFAGAASAPSHVTAAERELAQAILPTATARAVQWSMATMELAQVVCRARQPACQQCPVAPDCRWRALGFPNAEARTTARQDYLGTDRYVRGLVLQSLRDGRGSRTTIDALWPNQPQLSRAVESLVADGLATADQAGNLTLP